jgi:hypothetical protein
MRIEIASCNIELLEEADQVAQRSAAAVNRPDRKTSVHGTASDTIIIYNLTFLDQSRNAGMSIGER